MEGAWGPPSALMGRGSLIPHCCEAQAPKATGAAALCGAGPGLEAVLGASARPALSHHCRAQALAAW